MQEPVVRVQYGHLLLASLDNMIMAMSHMTHIVDAVKDLLIHLVEHVLAFGSYNFYWVSIEEQLARRPHMFLSQRYGFLPWNLLL